MAHTGIACLLLILLLAACADARRCAPDLKPLPCGKFKGIIYSLNGEAPKQVTKVSSWNAPNITAQSTFAISVCNFGNYRINGSTIRGESIIPTLVGWVGKNARVRVRVHNSGNLYVHKRLVVGMVLPEGKRYVWRHGIGRVERKVVAPDTSIIGKIVDGVVADDAHVAVEVKNSANVRMLKGSRDVHIGKGTLLNEIVNARKPRNEACAKYVCYDIVVANSANVKGVDGMAHMYIRDGQLEDETLDTGCLGRDTFVSISKRHVANVDNVAKVHIYDGELSDETVDAGNLLGAIINIKMKNVGNIRQGGDVRILDGELVDEMVDAKHVDNVYVKVDVKNVGNVVAKKLTIIEGELVDEIFDTGALVNSDVSVTLKDVGNVKTSNSVSISQGELVDEVIDIGFMKNTDVHVDMHNVGNVHTKKSISINGGELVDEVFDSKSTHRGSLKLKLKDVANVRCVPGAKLSVKDGELLETVADISGKVDHTKASVTIEKSGFAYLPNSSVTFVNATFAKQPVEVDLSGTSIELTVLDGEYAACT